MVSIGSSSYGAIRGKREWDEEGKGKELKASWQVVLANIAADMIESVTSCA